MTREVLVAHGIGVVTAVGLIVASRASAKAPPTPKIPRPTPDIPVNPPPAPESPDDILAPLRTAIEHVPSWLVEGGAPPSDHELLGWYSYKGRWIRIDGEHDADSAPASSGHQHPHGFLWWEVVEDATPIASARAWNEQASFEPDANLDGAAAKAAAWIDSLTEAP